MLFKSFSRQLGAASVVLSAAIASASPVSKAAIISKVALNTVNAGASRFVENAGQWDSSALFLSRTKGLNLWITQDGAVFDFNRFVETSPITRVGKSFTRHGYIQGQVVKMTLLNANLTAVTGESIQSGINNYFIGNDSAKWATNVRGYAQAVAEQPYKGVSLHYLIDQGAPRYDLYVKPGADISQIGLKIDGVDAVQVLANGNLQLKTSLGVIEERGLTAYQDTPSGRNQVACRMVLDGNVLHFDVGSYDTSRTLVIDPLLFSTFLGGQNGDDAPTSVALDASNNVYVGGVAATTTFPTTTGAYQTKEVDANGSGYVTKLNEAETELVYSTYIGGTGGGNGDQVLGIAVDKSEDAYITGITYASKFPTTTGAFQTTNKELTNGGPAGFVTKFNSAGTALAYSTYLAGAGDGNGNGDSPAAIAVDTLGYAYIVGSTQSANFPTTTGSFQTANKEVNNDGLAGFIVKLNTTGTALTYGTYLAGTGDGNGNGDAIAAVAVDSSYNVYVGGFTFSTDFPELGGYQTTNKAAINDEAEGFVTKLASTGKTLSFSTYLGGSNSTGVNGIAVNSGLDVFVTGATASVDFPVTPTAYQVWDPETNTSGAGTTGFVSELASTGKTLAYSTYLGGSGGVDWPTAIKLDSSSDAFVTGYTASMDFPVTAGAYETVSTLLGGTGGEPTTCFITKLAPTGTSLLYSTFFGGSGDGAGDGDSSVALALNSGFDAVVVGDTTSPDFPVTGTGYDQVYAYGFVSTLELTTATGTISSISINPNPIPSGDTAIGTIVLTNALSTDTTFKLTFTGPALVPASVTIPAGESQGSFELLAEGVNASTALDITATAGSLTKTVDTHIVPATLETTAAGGLILNQSDVLGGATVGATVSLTGLAGSSGATVALTSSDPAAAAVESSVVIPYNASSARTTIKTAPVSGGTNVTITAKLGSVTTTATLQIRTARVARLTVPADAVGGATVTGTILLSAPAGPVGDTVSLSSSSSDAQVPGAVLVPAGKTSVTFNIATKAVTANVTAIITATYAEQSQTANIVVEK